jgi:hypothetical protein
MAQKILSERNIKRKPASGEAIPRAGREKKTIHTLYH